MTDLVLFHHAQGLTDGVRAIGARFTDAGITVSLPDLYGGRVFDDLDAGVAYAGGHGEQIDALAAAAVADAAPGTTLAGMSLGAGAAQQLAMTRPGLADALLLLHDGISSADMGLPWPGGIRVQMHLAEADPWCDVDSARALAQESGGDLHLYPGSEHLFTDASLPAYRPELAELCLQRALAFVAG